MSDPYALSTIVVIDLIGSTGQSVQYSYDLSEYVGLIPSTAKYIAWRTPYGMTSYAYLDDVSFISVACPLTKPSISELTGSSVRISSGLRTSDNWIILVTNHLVSEEDLSDDDRRRGSFIRTRSLLARKRSSVCRARRNIMWLPPLFAMMPKRHGARCRS